MPDFDYAPVSSPDEEEQKRRELAELYPPVGPPLTAGVSAPPVGSTADLESRAGRTHEYAPAEAPQPIAPAPKWKDYAPAEPHGWSKVGHTLAGLWGPTDRVFNQRPMDQAVDRYKAATQEHEAPIEERAKTAQAEKNEADADVLRHPPLKPKEEDWEVAPGVTNAKGEVLQYEKTSGQTRWAPGIAGATPLKEPTTPDKDKDISDYLAAHQLTDTPENREKARGDIANRGKQEPGSFMPLYGKDGAVVGAWDPKSGRIIKNPDLPGTTAAGVSANRAEITAHDKAYVQPAEGVEKSYQMMNAAYQEYEAARKQGKDLPTGAQSMLALSTHLSTTFGNVKGARVTKDMIQEHLGARSISDSALVAIQKLTNGDVLSPDQWTAFHDLISNSRKLSWQTAAKEADRKHIPVDFLPKDLQGASHEPGEGIESPSTPTATGPNGEKITVKDGKWVDLKTGKPVQ